MPISYLLSFLKLTVVLHNYARDSMEHKGECEMESTKKFGEILRKDGKMKLLLGGMLLDGALILALVITVGLIAL
jgi:hypothetical protein